MRVLDLTGHAADQFPKADVDKVYTHRAGMNGYDVVVTRHHLAEHLFVEAPDYLKQLADYLVEGGEIHLLEPSAEWAAREIKAGRMDVPWYIHVYGTEMAQKCSIFALEQLREIVTDAGLLCRIAMTRPYTIAATEDGREFQADQHYIVAVKPGGGKTWMPD